MAVITHIGSEKGIKRGNVSLGQFVEQVVGAGAEAIGITGIEGAGAWVQSRKRGKRNGNTKSRKGVTNIQRFD